MMRGGAETSHLELARQLVSVEQFYPTPQEMKARFLDHPSREQIANYVGMAGLPPEVLFYWPTERRVGKLVDQAILRHMIAGNIIIHPFNAIQLGPNSYDVALGNHFFRSREAIGAETRLYDTFDPVDVREAWKYEQARKAHEVLGEHGGSRLRGVKGDDYIFILYSGEMVLGHTDEIIGGINIVIPEISGKSTSGRNKIEMCSDARMGNIGYVNRYTLEILNKGRRPIPLVVGQSYASFEFVEVNEPPIQNYSVKGQYARAVNLQAVMRAWAPESMLPRMKRLEGRIKLELDQLVAEGPREGLRKQLKAHKRAAQLRIAADGKIVQTKEMLALIIKEGHKRDMQLGRVVNEGWGGEGCMTIAYKDGIVSYGGDMRLGGVGDEDVYEIHVPSLTVADRNFFSSLREFSELVAEIEESRL